MIITKVIYNKIIKLYPKWLELNQELRKIYTRGINLNESFTEIIACYHYDLELNIRIKSNSSDAIDKQGKRYQIKGSSSCENDLSSFGPRSKFDFLIYACINLDNPYQLKLYRIPIQNISNLKMNKQETFLDQQKQGRRPRFSIYKKIIAPYELVVDKIVDLKKQY